MFTQSVNNFTTIILAILKNFEYSQKPQKKALKILRISQLLFLVGTLSFSLSLVYRIQQSTRLSFVPTQANVHNTQSENAIPTFINIPKTDITLRIDETKIQNGVWEISEIGASHLENSANPGDANPIIIYGHNTQDRFGNITKLVKGDKITLTAQNGHLHTYIVSEIVIVNPDQVKILENENKEVLILYTCYGFADLKRFVVKAIPSS